MRPRGGRRGDELHRCDTFSRTAVEQDHRGRLRHPVRRGNPNPRIHHSAVPGHPPQQAVKTSVMTGKGTPRGPPASRFLAGQRLGHSHVEHDQMQFPSLASGAPGQPTTHPRPAAAVVDQHRPAAPRRLAQPPEVRPPHPGPVHRVRQTGGHHRLVGDMENPRIDDRRSPGPTPQQGALAAPRQPGDHHHGTCGIRQRGRHVTRPPQIHQPTRPQCHPAVRTGTPVRHTRPAARNAHYLPLDHTRRRAPARPTDLRTWRQAESP